MLKLENVHIRRGDYVVADSIDLTLEQGKVYSVLGPNGTGKSSLMKTIFGEAAHKGIIRLTATKHEQNPLQSGANA